MDVSPIGRLPAELRDSIYDAIFDWEDGKVDLTSLQPNVQQKASHERVGVLLACRQMHAECIERIHAANTFEISQQNANKPFEEVLQNFIRKIGGSNAGLLQNIHLKCTLTQGTFGNGDFRRSMRRIAQVASSNPRCKIRVFLTFLDIYKSIAIRAEMNMQLAVRAAGNAWIEVLEPIASEEDSEEVQDSMAFLRRQLNDCKTDLDRLARDGGVSEPN